MIVCLLIIINFLQACFIDLIKKMDFIETLGHTNSLHSNLRRLAGRGLERRPVPIAREARRPTRGTPEECANVFLDFLRQILAQKLCNCVFRGSARCDALGQRGPDLWPCWPPDPASAGDNPRRLPFILGRVRECLRRIFPASTVYPCPKDAANGNIALRLERR